MRILVAALNAQKGDLAGNPARHRAVLEHARVQGCRLAVFPEFSLTGRSTRAATPSAPCPSTPRRCGPCWRRPGGRAWPRCSASPSGPDPGSLVLGVPVDVIVHPVREPSAACWSTRPAGRCWWSSEELRASGAVVIPRALPGLLERIARRDLPDPDEDLGV